MAPRHTRPSQRRPVTSKNETCFVVIPSQIGKYKNKRVVCTILLCLFMKWLWQGLVVLQCLSLDIAHHVEITVTIASYASGAHTDQSKQE